MQKRFDILALLIGLGFIITGCAKKMITEKVPVEYIKLQLEKLAPVTLTSDLSYLPANEKQVVKLLVKAAMVMDDIFLDQVYENNRQILKELQISQNPDDTYFLELFKVMFSPWNRLEEDHPFINSIPKPDGANFYPADMTKEEFNEWIESHPGDRDSFKNEFTILERNGSNLIAVPYAKAYKKKLDKAAGLLRQAAASTRDETLATFLNSRADAFGSNDYYQSDMDWMDLAGDIEVVIGPYEVYEDNLFGYKAAFESFVCVVDHAESDNLKVIGEKINDMEAHLPIDDAFKNFNRGSESPVKVVNEIFTGGDTKAGVQTLAFNLPNDERVREAKGSKKVMLKNVMNAKYDKIYLPIAERILAGKDRNRVSFDAYFKHILMHEFSHGLGPGNIIKDGQETTVNKELKDLYSAIEECKADVLGVYNVQYLIDQDVLDKDLEISLYATNLGGMFRSIRFGIDSAHGGGVAMQLNYYLDKGAFQIGNDGLFSVNDNRMKSAVRDLAKELLMIQAKGDYATAAQFVEKYRVLRPEVQEALNRLEDVPVDIRPVYPIVKEID